MNETGNRLREARQLRGLSQFQVAELADVSRRTLQNVEAGRSVSKASVQAIAEVLEVELGIEVEQPFDKARSRFNLDFFSNVPWGLYKFARNAFPPNSLAFCFSEDEFKSTLVNQIENCFRNNYLPRLDIRKQSAFFASTPEMLTGSGFAKRYHSIWKANPYSIAFSSVNQRRSGVSVVLPVSKSTYGSFVSGEISCYEISGKDILPESQFLIYDFLLDYQGLEKQRHAIVDSLPFLGFYQLATLAKKPGANDFYLSTFANTAPNVARMNRAGFQKLATRTLDSKLPLWQLSAHDCDVDESGKAETVAHFATLKQRFLRRTRTTATLLSLRTCGHVFKNSNKMNAG